MLPAPSLTSLALLASSSVAAASPAWTRSANECFKNETEARLCYTASNDTAKGVSLDDLKFAAAHIRGLDQQYRAGRLYTMNVGDSPGCEERDLYTRSTARVKIKHIDTAHNSSVLYGDIANTLDGGANATDEQMVAALFGCGANGGYMGVIVNTTHPTYNSTRYNNLHAVPNGIIVKVLYSGYTSDERSKV